MVSKGKLYKFYGVILSDIVSITGYKRNDIHNKLKDYFNIGSLSDLSFNELYDYITSVQAHFASEYGLELPIKYQNMTLSEYLKQENGE